MPFLTGPPDIAVGLKPIPESKWLLPDTEEEAWLPGKRIIMATRPCFDLLPLSRCFGERNTCPWLITISKRPIRQDGYQMTQG